MWPYPFLNRRPQGAEKGVFLFLYVERLLYIWFWKIPLRKIHSIIIVFDIKKKTKRGGGEFINYSNMTSFFRFVNKRLIYRLVIISLAHAPVHMTDFPDVNVHVDELSSARIWQHKLCATLSANVNINYRLPMKVCYCICTLRHIRIEIIYGSQNVFWVLTWVDISKFYPSPLAWDKILISTNP